MVNPNSPQRSILVHSKTEKEHTSHLKLVLQKFYTNGIIVSGQKSQFYRKNIAYLGVEIGNGAITLQPHIASKIQAFEVTNTKSLQLLETLQTYREGEKTKTRTSVLEAEISL